jgi:peptidoglycan/LPS O-acetylase OafA/YrhL
VAPAACSRYHAADKGLGSVFMSVVVDRERGLRGRLVGSLVDVFGNWSTSRKAYPLGYVLSLDGARGIMILGVLVAHTHPGVWQGAIIYMDVFFAMSGYLITSLLLADHEKRGRIDFKKFYIRRFMRLYPALVAFLLVMVCVTLLFSSDRLPKLKEALIAFFYLTDYWRALNPTAIHYTNHLWSLGVEEQFYVLWPMLFALILRGFGVSWRSVAIIFAGAVLFWAWRIWLVHKGASISYLYNAFDTRADALLVGCGMAVLMKLMNLADYPRLAKILSASLLPMMLASVVACMYLSWYMRWYYVVSPLFGAIPATVLIISLVQGPRSPIHWLFEHPLAVFCGRICYATYIWHFPIFLLMRELGLNHVHILLIGWPITDALAVLSYYFIERHFMRARPV